MRNVEYHFKLLINGKHNGYTSEELVDIGNRGDDLQIDIVEVTVFLSGGRI